MKTKLSLGSIVLLLVLLLAFAATAADAPVTQTRTPGLEAFPESYKPYIEALQKAHPSWHFVAFDTGLTWDEVLDGETAVIHNNLVRLSTVTSWKSLAPGSFDWETSTFATFDGGRYHAASREIIAYYMDPRNSIGELRYLFQFEQLTFDPETQVEAGVKQILKGTFMEEDSLLPNFSSPDEEGAMTYAQAFMSIAKELNVSPYHLAARVRQEQNADGKSSLISGTYKGYEGYYNYFNISASGKTTAEIITNGLKRAQKEGWNTPYKALLGGSRVIADKYIAKGQDTLYLEKFDVAAPGGLYSHQYMQNLTAAYTESVSVYNSYDSMGLLGEPFTFVIPVYRDMPESACPRPSADGNPNNKLQGLGLSEGPISPEFHPDTGTYFATVGNDVHTITVNALPYANSATVSGDGKIGLAVGENVLRLTVTAERGDTRTYTLRVTRLADGENIIAMGNTTVNINLRSGPGTEYDVLTTVPAGRTVSVLAEENGWCQVIYGEYTGYMSKEHFHLYVPAKSLVLDKQTLSVLAGAPGKLTAITDPDPCDTLILWKTSDPAIATVENGEITGHLTGTVIITAYTEGGLNASCTVTVTEPVLYTGTINIKGSTLNVRNKPSTSGSTVLGTVAKGEAISVVEAQQNWCRIFYGDGTAWIKREYIASDPVPSVDLFLEPVTGEIAPGRTLTLTPTLVPFYSTEVLTWSSSNEAVARVESGVVTGISRGEAVITVTDESGHSASCTITVNHAADSVTLDKQQADLVMGQTLQLIATLSPADALETFTWSSSDETICTVKDGLVTPVGPGTVTITVTTYTGKTASCSITVTAPATEVKLDKSQLTLYPTGVGTLVMTPTPAFTTDSFTWSSSDESVCTVQNGIVTGVGFGTATVTVTASSGKSASCTVVVGKPTITVILDKTALNLIKGASDTLTPTLSPTGITDTLTWSSSDEAVCTVKDGVVTAVGKGTATITVKTTSDKTATCVVTVTVPATEVKLDKIELSLIKGESGKLTATLAPADTTDVLTWSSSNAAVCTVKDGVVTATGGGTATITVKTTSGKTATCTVTVTVPATEVKLDKAQLTLVKGASGKLTAALSPADTTDVLAWSSSDSAVCTVKDGVVTAVGKGAATITVKTTSGKTATCTVTVTVPASGVKLDKTQLTLIKGESGKLIATLTPADTTDTFTWSSSNAAVCTVKDGVITAVSSGTATITAKTTSGKTATCVVTVIIPSTEVKLDKTQMALVKGASGKLTATLTPADTTDTLTWSSSNTAVCTVKDGVVTATGGGTATVTVKTSSGKSATCTITVTVPATGITLDKQDATLFLGSTLTLNPTLSPADTTDALTWSSSDEAVAQVSNGVVTPKAEGSVIITATLGGKLQASCTILVKDPVPDKVTSETFTVTEEYIRKIPLGISVSDLLAGLKEAKYCKVFSGETEVPADTIVATGMVVQIVDGNKVKASYTLVVTGDADGDGAVTVNDYVVIKAHILKKSTLTGVFAEAADADGDGAITVNDYVEVKAHILKKSSITAK